MGAQLLTQPANVMDLREAAGAVMPK
jgi:hypothetical protein